MRASLAILVIIRLLGTKQPKSDFCCCCIC